MKHAYILFILLLVAAAGLFAAPTGATSWNADSDRLYEEGFMQMLKRGPGGITLFNRDLVENDSPGAGSSEKGVVTDVVWGKNRARKIFDLDEVRAEKARIVVYLANPFGEHPLEFTVNGHTVKHRKGHASDYYMGFYSIDIEPSWLRKGRNVVDVSCPEAQSAEEGWRLLIARADEFEAGGGNPADVGKTSFKSSDGGETWEESPFGPLRQTRAEYTVRISLDRYVRTGWLKSPVIDLWRGDSDAFYVSQRRLSSLTVNMNADVPAGTRVEYSLRKGTNPSPFSDEWGPFQPIGSGPKLEATAADSFTGRYIQLRAELSTENPLRSPVIKDARVTAEFTDPFPYPEHKNIYVVAVDNPPLRYSSLDWEWEKWDRPEFMELRARENLDEVIGGSQTGFEAQVKLLDYATKRWSWQSPLPAYPEWNALAILDRINQTGGGGMCIQFNNFLAGLCMSYGWHARLVNVDGHEVCEVWNDEFGKWIYLDANHYNHYLYDQKTGVPMSMLDLHNAHLDFFYPGKPVDWACYGRGSATPAEVAKIIGRGSLTRHGINEMAGFTNAVFMRIIPRTNWYEKAAARPLAHGKFSWPWNGYVNWYDERTPAKHQYSQFTDREIDIWPVLNTTHIHATSALGNDRLYLHFETYTPNFSHFEVQTNGGEWKRTREQWTWLFRSGRNTLAVRAVNRQGVKGKPSSATINYADVPFVDPMNLAMPEQSPAR